MIPDICELKVQSLKTHTRHVHEPRWVGIIAQIFNCAEHICDGKTQALLLCFRLQYFLWFYGSTVACYTIQERCRKWLSIKGVHG